MISDYFVELPDRLVDDFTAKYDGKIRKDPARIIDLYDPLMIS